jgi:hypothetical protein
MHSASTSTLPNCISGVKTTEDKNPRSLRVICMTSSNFETAQAKIHYVEPLSMTLNAKLMLFYVVLIKSQKLDVTQFYSISPYQSCIHSFSLSYIILQYIYSTIYLINYSTSV